MCEGYHLLYQNIGQPEIMGASPPRGQLTGKMLFFSSPFAPENFISGLNLVLTHGVSSAFRGGVHLFTNRHRLGHDFHQVTQWRSTSLPRVRPYMASNPVTGAVMLQVTMDQFNCALFSHTHDTIIGMKWAC